MTQSLATKRAHGLSFLSRTNWLRDSRLVALGLWLTLGLVALVWLERGRPLSTRPVRFLLILICLAACHRPVPPPMRRFRNWNCA